MVGGLLADWLAGWAAGVARWVAGWLAGWVRVGWLVWWCGGWVGRWVSGRAAGWVSGWVAAWAHAAACYRDLSPQASLKTHLEQLKKLPQGDMTFKRLAESVKKTCDDAKVFMRPLRKAVAAARVALARHVKGRQDVVCQCQRHDAR